MDRSSRPIELAVRYATASLLLAKQARLGGSLKPRIENDLQAELRETGAQLQALVSEQTPVRIFNVWNHTALLVRFEDKIAFPVRIEIEEA